MKFLNLLLLISLTYTTKAAKLNVASLNLKWFGIGGEISGELQDEYRQEWLKEFLLPHIEEIDVITFQEIINFKLLENISKEFDFKCLSYKNTYYKHQKVAICYNKNKYTHESLSDYPSYTIDDVGSVNGSRLRPAVILSLKNKSTRNKLANIIAVHLKASANNKSALTRLKQVEIIEAAIARNKSTPTIILGDFNTHKKEKTKLEKDDLDLYKDIFSDSKLTYVKNHLGVTYRVRGVSEHLDHIFVSDSIVATATRVNDACKLSPSNKKRFKNYLFYNRFISDHCLIQSTLTLK